MVFLCSIFVKREQTNYRYTEKKHLMKKGILFHLLTKLL